jgi:hypothetical protein
LAWLLGRSNLNDGLTELGWAGLGWAGLGWAGLVASALTLLPAALPVAVDTPDVVITWVIQVLDGDGCNSGLVTWKGGWWLGRWRDWGGGSELIFHNRGNHASTACHAFSAVTVLLSNTVCMGLTCTVCAVA